MHPAFSVIFFTTVSGAGYGLALWTVWMQILLPDSNRVAWGVYVIAGVMIAAGLLASTLHLGQPQRAWRAFSQWRTSWLSREGVMAMISFIPLALLIALEFFAIDNSVFLGVLVWDIAAIGLIVGVHLTIHCTAMIYASLKPIYAWHHWLVPLGYQIYAIVVGGMMFVVSDISSGIFQQQTMIALLLCFLCGGWHLHVYHLYVQADNTNDGAVSALGLQDRGVVSVRTLESPNGPNNYLLKEMGYRLARYHAQTLRRLCLICLIFIPICILVMVTLGDMVFLIWVALISTCIGIGIERWLFFAQAKHRVTLYY